MKKFLRTLEDLIKIQSSHGNWNYDPYMRGLANGLLIARSVAINKEPKFFKEPAEYLTYKPNNGKPPVAVESV